MTIKLNYNITEEFTSAQIGDYAEPPLTYKVWRNRQAGWTEAASAFLEAESARREGGVAISEHNVKLALEVVGLSLISVDDGEKTHAIGGAKKAGELKKAAEQAADASYGDRYIIALADAIITRQIEREKKMVENLKKSSPPSGAGAAIEPSNGKTAQPTPSKETT